MWNLFQITLSENIVRFYEDYIDLINRGIPTVELFQQHVVEKLQSFGFDGMNIDFDDIGDT